MSARRLVYGLALLACPGIPWAQSLPPSVRACAANTDAERRHACYDREVERILDAEKANATPHSRAAEQDGAAPVPRTAATHGSTTAPRAAPAAPQESTLNQSNSTRSTAARTDERLSARIASVDTAPDELVLHLDNGEVWEQADRTSGGLGLHAGDTVTIEKHLGSYWLSARHVSGMRVRKKSD